ncbi:MAG: hypothetical protein P794_00865 [Epsilonproteobacteria bacterium (ex Lamellibrachia satsuma)]|nr:MAG: hypothetical protein P794_00865 [Epsilonproteobacteria bacterium (ex Lamellibrachia satsuma)]
MFKLLPAAILLLGLSGCGTSNLNYNNQQLTLQADKKFVQMNGTLLKIRRDSYGSLYLSQKILRLDEGNVVVYEDARTDILYEFEPNITRSIKVIFESKSTVIIYGKDHLYAYQLILQNGKILNVIAQQDDSQRLRMVYGMSSVQLDKILNRLDPNAKRAYYRKVITVKEPNKAILSKWNVQKVHFYPLVSPLPKMLAI